MIRMGNSNFYGSSNLRIKEGDPPLSHFSIMMMRDESEAALRQLAEALLPGLMVEIGTYVGSPELIITDSRCGIITKDPEGRQVPRLAHIVPDGDILSRIVLIDTIYPLHVKLEGDMDTPERRAALVALGFSERPGFSR